MLVRLRLQEQTLPRPVLIAASGRVPEPRSGSTLLTKALAANQPFDWQLGTASTATGLETLIARAGRRPTLRSVGTWAMLSLWAARPVL